MESPTEQLQSTSARTTRSSQQAALAYNRSEYALQKELLGRARACFEKIDGPRSESVGRTLAQLVTALKGEGKPEEAKTVGNEALAILRAQSDPPELTIAQCLSFMAGIEDTLGNPDEASRININL